MKTQAPIFTAWLDDFFTSYYRHRPVNATFIGVHEYDDRLPDFSEDGAGEALAEMETLLSRLRRLPPEPLSEAEAIDRQLAEGFLEIQRWEYTSDHFHRGNPSLYVGEAIFGVMSLFLRPFAPLSQRVEAAMARLKRVPVLLAQGKAHVRQAPAAWTERASRECTGALAFLGVGVDLLMHAEDISEPRLRAAADKAAAAFADFQRYLEGELRPHSTEAYACGAEAFDLLLRKGHFLEMNAEAVKAYAETVFAESQAALEAHAADFGAQNWQEALAQRSNHYPTVEQYYARYAEIWEACRAAAEEHGLLTWPDYPIRYVSRPVWAREAAPYLYFLFYRAPAAFDRLPVIDYLVTPIEPDMPPAEQERLLRVTNDSVIKLNHVIHHGGIGHHVQNWYAYHRAGSRISQVAAVDCACRIAMFCGGTMAEGWACYATDLMDEIGFLTPLEHYSQYHARLRMAARAIVDVNLHHGIFTLEEAVAFYRDRVGMTQEAAYAEAVKNSMFPGTAMMYLIGTDLIHELRRDVMKRPAIDISTGTVQSPRPLSRPRAGPEGSRAEGPPRSSRLNLRQFHDRFLSYGSVPVSLIAAAMRELNHEEGR